MSSALSVICQFLFFNSFRPLDILVQHIVHDLGVCCILLIEECTTLILVLYIIYTGQPSFCLVHFYDLHIWLSQFYLVKCRHPFTVSTHFIFFTHLPKLYYAFYHHMLCLISGSFCLVLILFWLSYKLYLKREDIVLVHHFWVPHIQNGHHVVA